MTDLAAQAQDSRFVATLRLVRAWWPSEASFAARLALTSVAAIYLCMLFELETPEWAGWTVVSVSLAARANSLQKSLWRVLGTIVGALISFAIVDAFAQATLAFDIALALYIFVITTISNIQRGFRVYGFAVMGYTVPIVILNDVQRPQLVFYTAVDRCSTIVVGVACAYVSFALVAPGVRTVARNLANVLDAAVEACSGWGRQACRRSDESEASTKRPPLGNVLALDSTMQDAFTEQPSLRAGALALAQAPITLLHLLAMDMLRCRRPTVEPSPRALLGRDFVETDAEWDHLRELGPRLRRLEHRGLHHAPPKPLAIDWDGVQAMKNGLRAVLAVSLTNAFWYVSNWPPGGAMVSWAALASVLYATRDDGAQFTRNFLIGAVMAAAVGVFARYVILEQSSSLAQLAIVLFPVMMLAAIGYNEKAAAFGGGYAFLILGIIQPTNIQNYDLGASLNGILATLIGVWVVVACFTYILPSATPATRRRRAQRRMANAVRAIGRRPTWLLPSSDTWLARQAQRLARVCEDPKAVEGGEILLLVGLLLLATRRRETRVGREAARAIWSSDRADTFDRLADGSGDAMHRARLRTIADLLQTDSLRGWPGAPKTLAA